MEQTDKNRFKGPEFIQVDSPPARSGVGLQRAFCKTNAGSGSTISCYLGADSSQMPEITVHCDLFEATNLSACLPLLTDGRGIPVYQSGGVWYCAWWFTGTEVCSSE
jgi:hypothetical protein